VFANVYMYPEKPGVTGKFKKFNVVTGKTEWEIPDSFPNWGGALVTGISWHWIFWINVPVGIVVAILAMARLTESRGTNTRFDIPGVILATGGLFGIVYGVVRANELGWGSVPVLGAMLGGALMLIAFAVWLRGLLASACSAAGSNSAVYPSPVAINSLGTSSSVGRIRA